MHDVCIEHDSALSRLLPPSLLMVLEEKKCPPPPPPALVLDQYVL